MFRPQTLNDPFSVEVVSRVSSALKETEGYPYENAMKKGNGGQGRGATTPISHNDILNIIG